MKTKILTALALSCLTMTACAKQKSNTIETELSTEQMMAYLVDDNKLGRETGSAPMLEIQDWLIQRYKEFGIKPIPGSNSYRQDFIAKTKASELDAANILGYIDCNCDSDKYFIIGAHYDHVGTNPKLEGDIIFNGADDDASGVVASLIIGRELAKALSLIHI